MSRQSRSPQLRPPAGALAPLCLVGALALCAGPGCLSADPRGMYRGQPGDGGVLLPLDAGEEDLLRPADLTSNSLGPSVQIVSPPPDTLLKSSRVLVAAEVTRGTSAEVTTVQARVLGQMKTVPMALRAGSTTRYEAEIDLSELRTGATALLVDAVNTRMITNTAQVSVIYDAGPTLSVREPSGLSYRGSAPLLFEARGDSNIAGGKLKGLRASVQGVPISLTVDLVSEYLATGSGVIIFRAKEFPLPLTGTQVLRVEAENENGVTSRLEKPFTIDEAGPAIEFTAPKAGEIVGGVITLTVSVTDPSGVDDTSVVGVWLNDAARYTVELVRVPGTDTFTARFDTRRLPEPQSLIYPSLSYRARDRLGNQASRGEVLILDNTPPVLSLQPPNTQLVTKDSNLPTGFKCSVSFNPLGTHSSLIKDGQVFGQVVTVRARVTERGNVAPGLAIENLSGLDPATIEALATPLVLGGAAPSPPLVVDADGKGTCNNLNPLLTPTSSMNGSNQALVLRMVNITVAGQLRYSDDLRAPFAAPFPKVCDRSGENTDPGGICSLVGESEPLFTYALPGQIWTIGPVTSRECAGLQLDSLNVLPEGPYCVAVRGADLAGNRNISKPLRICIERPIGSGACSGFRSAVMAGALPSCLGRFDPMTQTATTGAGAQCTLEPTAPYPRPQEPYRL